MKQLFHNISQSHTCYTFIHLYIIFIYIYKDNYLSGYLLGKSEYGIYHGWYDFGIQNLRPKNTWRCVTGSTVWFKHTKFWILLHGLCLNFQYLSDSSDCQLSASKKSQSSVATHSGMEEVLHQLVSGLSHYLCFFRAWTIQGSAGFLPIRSMCTFNIHAHVQSCLIFFDVISFILKKECECMRSAFFPQKDYHDFKPSKTKKHLQCGCVTVNFCRTCHVERVKLLSLVLSIDPYTSWFGVHSFTKIE